MWALVIAGIAAIAALAAAAKNASGSQGEGKMWTLVATIHPPFDTSGGNTLNDWREQFNAALAGQAVITDVGINSDGTEMTMTVRNNQAVKPLVPVGTCINTGAYTLCVKSYERIPV